MAIFSLFFVCILHSGDRTVVEMGDNQYHYVGRDTTCTSHCITLIRHTGRQARETLGKLETDCLVYHSNTDTLFNAILKIYKMLLWGKLSKANGPQTLSIENFYNCLDEFVMISVKYPVEKIIRN